MAKNFKKSLGSKNLASLIPTTDTTNKETTPAKEKVIKTPEPVVSKKQATTTNRKSAITKQEPKQIKQEPVSSSSASIEKEVKIQEPIIKESSNKKAISTTVATFRINDDKLLAIKAIAFWDRKKIQEVFDEALGNYIDQTPKNTLKKAITEYKKRQNK